MNKWKWIIGACAALATAVKVIGGFLILKSVTKDDEDEESTEENVDEEEQFYCKIERLTEYFVIEF